jgi:hypothetical protein
MSSYDDLVKIDATTTEMIGIRILKKKEDGTNDYQMIHEFVGDHWKESARLVLPMYSSSSTVAFHTLHRFLPWADAPESQKQTPFWLHNPYFHMTYLR